jgi:hypothetical protein
MKLIAVGLALIWMASCATQNRVDNGYSAALSHFKDTQSAPEFWTYVHAFVDTQNALKLDSQSGCYNLNVGTPVSLIVVINGGGRITGAYTDNESAKAKCFRASFLGAHMPIPPMDPWYMRLTMR